MNRFSKIKTSKIMVVTLLVLASFGATQAEQKNMKKQLVGTWECQKDAGLYTLALTETKISVFFKGAERTGLYAVDTSTTPKRLDIKWNNMESIKTIVQFKSMDELLMAENSLKKPRPLNFDERSVVLKRKNSHKAGLSDTTKIDGSENTIENPAAQWMSGKWGIGWRISAGDNKYSKRYKVDRVVEQVKTIPGMTYVLFNLSQGASGDSYTAPHSVLSKVNPGSCSQRDLFGELATAFQAEGYKVLVYMATEGPAKLKHGTNNGRGPQGIENWKTWVKKKYGSSDEATLKKAYAEVIVREFAQRYGTKIDGWWFDHASFGNIDLIHREITKANPKAIISFNRGKLGITENSNPAYEDYTFGHPTPLRRVPANSKNNLPMVTSIEDTENGFLIKEGKPSLGHLFMPMKNRWNSGVDVVWPEEQAVDWMQRVLKAGGAWTWNVPFDDKASQLDPEAVDFAKRVGSQLR
jgi:hypothetical protein